MSFVTFYGSIKIKSQNKIYIPLCMKINVYETFVETFNVLCDYSILSLELYFSSALSWLKFEQEVVVLSGLHKFQAPAWPLTKFNLVTAVSSFT
jgi:hypothetical protein